MSNKVECSYKRYHQYRANKRHYSTSQFAAPIAMVILIAVFSKYWWLVLGVVTIVLISKYVAPYMLDSKKDVPETQNEIWERGCVMEEKSTDVGYINKNNQKNLGKTKKPGTDNNQWFYQMECQECGHKYYANGTDVWLRKCPKCQGGQP